VLPNAFGQKQTFRDHALAQCITLPNEPNTNL
jgi:hypothetical protein